MTWYYVDKAAPNGGNGSYALPWNDLATPIALLGVLPTGTRILVRPTGIYTERLIINAIAGGASGIVFEGDPDYGPTLPIVTSNNSHGCLINDSSNITVQRFEFRLPTATPADTVTISGTCSDILIKDCVIKDAASNAVLMTDTNTRVTISGCTITNATTDGIGGDDTCNSFVVEYNAIDKCGDNTYTGGAGDGISFHDDSNGIIRFNKIRRCSKGGITNVQNAGNTIYCIGNILSDCVQWTMAGHQNGTNTIGDHVWVANVIFMSDTSALNGGTQPRGMMFRGRTDAVNTFTVYNNVVINLIASILSISYGDFGSAYTIKVLMKNNVSYMGATGTGKHVWISNPTWWASGTVVDYGLYSKDSGQQWAEDVTGYNFANWQANSNLPDIHGSVQTGTIFTGTIPGTPGAYNWETDANRWPAAITASLVKPTILLKGLGLIQAGERAYPDIEGNYIPNAGQTALNVGAFFGQPVAGFPGTQEGGTLTSEQSSGSPNITGLNGKPSRPPKAVRMPDPMPRGDHKRVRHPTRLKDNARMR